MSVWPPSTKNHLDVGELMLRRHAEFQVHKSAVEKEQDWASATGIGESPDELQHRGHVVPVVRVERENHVSSARKGFGGSATIDDLWPASCVDKRRGV